MTKDYKIYLRDILNAMESIEGFVAGTNYDQFRKDDKTASAVIRKFEVIGEATKQIPEEIRKANPQVPWKEMAGMRDKLIHFYAGVDYGLVWMTIHERIPGVKFQLEQILEEKR